MSALTAADIILRPVISEKSIDVSTLTDRNPAAGNKYTFAVHRDANKQQIKQAVERIYDVKVADVRTMNRKGKPRRSRYKMTHTSAWKRAVVVLDENSRIELF